MARSGLEEMPLFPLNTVLFPFASLSLHVFEDRYKAMVRRCLDEGRPFGVVLIRSGDEVGGQADPYLVGTAVDIVQSHTYPDGAMDLHVMGLRRFRIRDLDDEGPYLVGYVEPVEEAQLPGPARSEPVLNEAKEQFELLVERLFAKQDLNVSLGFPKDPVALSFTMANLLPLENLQKQMLLETTDALQRVETLIPILYRQIQELEGPPFVRLTSRELADWITAN